HARSLPGMRGGVSSWLITPLVIYMIAVLGLGLSDLQGGGNVLRSCANARNAGTNSGMRSRGSITIAGTATRLVINRADPRWGMKRGIAYAWVSRGASLDDSAHV